MKMKSKKVLPKVIPIKKWIRLQPIIEPGIQFRQLQSLRTALRILQGIETFFRNESGHEQRWHEPRRYEPRWHEQELRKEKHVLY